MKISANTSIPRPPPSPRIFIFLIYCRSSRFLILLCRFFLFLFYTYCILQILFIVTIILGTWSMSMYLTREGWDSIYIAHMANFYLIIIILFDEDMKETCMYLESTSSNRLLTFESFFYRISIENLLRFFFFCFFNSFNAKITKLRLSFHDI